MTIGMANPLQPAPSPSVAPATSGQTSNYQTYETSLVQQDWQKQSWFRVYWRSGAAWSYLIICLFDFIIFPFIWTALQYKTGTPLSQWTPLTLNGGGLFHVAFGAIVGVSSWGRTKEKLGSVA